jgi:hypothetical protein
MDYTGGNQLIVDLDMNSTHDTQGPFRTVVRGFSRYAETVDSLPLLERIKMVIVTDFVIESFLPGNLPIVGMRLIGHADTDPQREQREPGFVQGISEKRAAEIERVLRKDIARGTWIYVGRVGPTPDKIRWAVSGVGASQPDEENVKRKKTHANMTEQDRKLNRRVEILLAAGSTPVPQPQANDPWEMIRKAIQEWLAQRPKLPWDRLPGPKNREDYTTFKCNALEQLKKFDVDTALSSLKDMILKDPSQSSDWTNSLRQMVDEIDKRRRESQKEWWKDDDCPQQPPDPTRKARLLVEPRIVNLKRGGEAIVKVSVVDRPYAGPIEVTLRNLPPKVTAPKRAIPTYQNYTEIPLDAEADAPVTNVPSVFAEAYYPNVVTLLSDTFTVSVR